MINAETLIIDVILIINDYNGSVHDGDFDYADITTSTMIMMGTSATALLG